MLQGRVTVSALKTNRKPLISASKTKPAAQGTKLGRFAKVLGCSIHETERMQAQTIPGNSNVLHKDGHRCWAATT
jgi:hypothetical protein